MNIYSVVELENKIDRFAEEHEGEIPDALYEELVAEQCKSVQQIENLVKYIRSLDLGIEMCDTEIKRIKAMKDKAKRRIDGIETYLTPYVKMHHKIEAGTFVLTTRKSESVNIINEKEIPIAYMHEIPVKLEPDKNMIKRDIKAGKNVPGAELQESDNLTIK